MDTYVYGVGDEVLLVAVIIAFVVVPLFVFGLMRTDCRVLFRPVTNIYRRFFPSVPQEDDGTRVENMEPGGIHAPARTYNPERCPICLNNHQLAVETNCGHLYCGSCLRAYIYIDGLMTQISCPMCRQSVTILFPCFTEEELQASPTSTVRSEIGLLFIMVETYNRRFSGAPRTLLETIQDMPTLLRHLWNEFFSVGGLMTMFRIRIGLCFLAAVLYLFSPLDMIPEAIFGIIGFLDDIFVLFVLAIYISIIYRRIVSTRRMPI